MWHTLRVVLRLVAVVCLGVAIYLVVMKPTATVLGSSLLTKVDVGVQCSSEWSQWTGSDKPAALLLNGQPLTSVPEAQSSCANAGSTIKKVAGGLAGAAVLITAVSLLRRRAHL